MQIVCKICWTEYEARVIWRTSPMADARKMAAKRKRKKEADSGTHSTEEESIQNVKTGVTKKLYVQNSLGSTSHLKNGERKENKVGALEANRLV